MFSQSVHSSWPRYRVEVPALNGSRDGEDGETNRQVLVAKPTFRARGMSDRRTRGYVALDYNRSDFMWLKDAWRTHYLLVDKEGQMLQKLNKAQVMNMPTLICHGDIQDQVSLTPEEGKVKSPALSLSISEPESDTSCSRSFVASQPPKVSSSSFSSRKRKHADEGSEDNIPPPTGVSTGSAPFQSDCLLRPQKRYRSVEKEVGMPLAKIKGGRQLVSIITDCIYAHFQAATKPEAQILHRDTSGGNILIMPCILTNKPGAEVKRRDLLTDWDMSKPINVDQQQDVQAHQLERTGTWQFLSAALLFRPKEIEICDELEAFFYIILYHAVRYLRSNIHESAIVIWISNFFETYNVKGDTYLCGDRKWHAIQSGTLVTVSSEFSKTAYTFLTFDSPLDAIFEDFLQWFKAHHVVTQHNLKEKELAGAPPVTLQGSSGMVHSNEGRRNPRPERPKKAKPPRKPRGRKAGEPSDEDREFCDYVLTYDAMMDRLEEALDDESV